MNENPDKNRKTDNLRDLVTSLLDQKKLDILQGFCYGNMEQQLRDILLTRARATDAIDNVYYDFLYSYEISKGTPFYRMGKYIFLLLFESTNVNKYCILQDFKNLSFRI